MTVSDPHEPAESKEGFAAYQPDDGIDAIQDPLDDDVVQGSEPLVAEPYVPGGVTEDEIGDQADDAGSGDATDAEPHDQELTEQACPEPEPDPTWVKVDGTDTESAAEAAQDALEAGECVVIPTDTVYGIGADAYEAEAVAKLLAAKGRGRDMPPPVLIADTALVKALVTDVPAAAEALTARHWPGPLTVILRAQPNLGMDLGDTDQTVAVRVPDHAVAREILRRTGPLAVSSANKSGQPAAVTIDDAIDQLGNSVAVYVDGGLLGGADTAPSTIVDFTQSPDGIVLRLGALSLEALRVDAPQISVLEPSDPAEKKLSAARRRPENPLARLTQSQSELADSIRSAAALDPNVDAVIAGSDEPNAGETIPDETGRDKTAPDETSPDRASSDQTSSDQTSSDGGPDEPGVAGPAPVDKERPTTDALPSGQDRH
ncbi:MAG: threonylcarbamoyl-AMP synthase [Propionibacteriales bacterium]|nr:threonylcarbamoyl-AMP synthase [Propionibacteriales bacterium]